MKKFKLSTVRSSKGFTQQKMAERLFMDVSNYSRRENGTIKISNYEWKKLAEILDVSINEIYESDDSKDNYLGNNNIYFVPEYFLDIQRKYINTLEKEIENLRKKLEKDI
ncbi:helix-turn-helix domain-containing protein [Flavobacterium sp.]|jgi:transcriptional regulator with XRE-family HTH domain|uniref:helix-turn-helix domain-containing protein n=1 Tax=Flavobacterium sp. TaxID=239 RepID=UPI003783C94F